MVDSTEAISLDAAGSAPPKTQRHALNDYARRWELDGDLIRCRCCDRAQQVSWALHKFPHRSDCKNETAERGPWVTLASLLTAQISRARPPAETEDAGAIVNSGLPAVAAQASADATPTVLVDRLAREIAANVAADVEAHYPALAGERFVFNLKAWARGEVNRWFGKPEAGSADIDARLRASGAHRRHIRRLRTLNGTVQPDDPVEPLLAAMSASQEQAALDARAGGPVIEGEAAQ